jgi:hypothetical protein
MLTAAHRHQILLADRSRDVATVTAAVRDVLAANPLTTLPEIELALRDAAAQSYVIADGADFRIVIGIAARLAALKPVDHRVEPANPPG